MRAAAIEKHTVYELGPFHLDTEARVLTHYGAPTSLGARGVAVLAALVSRAGKYVGKSLILDAAWPGVVVEEANLAVQISAIRRVLAQEPHCEQWIETLARRGYRFVGPVGLASRREDEKTDSPGNLPHPTSRFIGRQRELAVLKELLGRRRLLTLTGSGGCGKTRLSLQLASESKHLFADGAWWAELAALNEPGFLEQTVAAALDLKEESNRTIEETLLWHLEQKHVLLLLDNCEHLLNRCAVLVEALLRRCPRLTIVATSREHLGLDGEQVYRVPSMSVPDLEQASIRDHIKDFEAVELLLDRASRARAEFDLTDDNSATIASICRRLDGIPLAIELAAARMRTLSPQQVLDRLDQRFQLLTGGARTALPRQQTLRSLIDWSHDRLREPEKLVFEQLSVFSAGWTLAAAEAVCTDGVAADGSVLDVLTSLCDKSLVLAEDGASRYRLLETVRQYADERLAARGSVRITRSRHRNYYLALAETAAAELQTVDQAMWLQRLELEHDNIRAALDWSLADAQSDLGLRLCAALQRFWLLRGYFSEGREWCARFLEKTEPRVHVSGRAKVLDVAAILARRQGDYLAARRSVEESMSIHRRLDEREGLAGSLDIRGKIALEEGDSPAAQVLFEESLAISVELANLRGIARALHSLGVVACTGDPARGKALFEQSLEVARELQDLSVIQHNLWDLGIVTLRQGDLSAAKDLFERSLAICRSLGDQTGIAAGQHQLGHVALEMKDYATARKLFAEGLRIRRRLGDRPGIAYSLEGSAAAIARLGDHLRGGLIWGAAERLRERIGSPLPAVDRRRYNSQVAAARVAGCNAAGFHRAWRDGRDLALDEAITLAREEQPLAC